MQVDYTKYFLRFLVIIIGWMLLFSQYEIVTDVSDDYPELLGRKFKFTEDMILLRNNKEGQIISVSHKLSNKYQHYAISKGFHNQNPDAYNRYGKDDVEIMKMDTDTIYRIEKIYKLSIPGMVMKSFTGHPHFVAIIKIDKGKKCVIDLLVLRNQITDSKLDILEDHAYVE